MNYCEHHFGDYLKKAGHLSLLEHGVFGRLRDVYLSSEAPLPDARVERLVGARLPEECAAVRTVLGEFFELRGLAWHRAEFDAAIAAYVAGEPEREAKKSNEAIRLQNHRDEKARLFGLLRAAGMHADWNIKIGPLRALVAALPATAPATAATPATDGPAPDADSAPTRKWGETRGCDGPPASDLVSPCPIVPATRSATAPATLQALHATATATPATATHSPIPNTHYPKGKERTRADKPAALARPEDVSERVWKDWCALRKEKRAAVTETVVAHARKQSTLAAMPLEEFLTIWCARGSQGLEAAWLKPNERASVKGATFKESRDYGAGVKTDGSFA